LRNCRERSTIGSLRPRHLITSVLATLEIFQTRVREIPKLGMQIFFTSLAVAGEVLIVDLFHELLSRILFVIFHELTKPDQQNDRKN
jgi:hypothetical protein